MHKKLKLIDLTKMKKSCYFIMQQQQQALIEADKQLAKYTEITNELGYTDEIKELLKTTPKITQEQRQAMQESIDKETQQLKHEVMDDIKSYKKQLDLEDNLLKHRS